MWQFDVWSTTSDGFVNESTDPLDMETKTKVTFSSYVKGNNTRCKFDARNLFFLSFLRKKYRYQL